jgi:hypothetical protein
MPRTEVELHENQSITEEKLAANSVSESKIKESAVTKTKLHSSLRPTPFTTRGFNYPI